jgi:hypothetical protein
VADGGPAREPGEARLVEDVGDVAHFPLDGEVARRVERGDPGRLLAAVLEGVEAEVGEPGGVLRIVDAENAAFVAEAGTRIHAHVILTFAAAPAVPCAERSDHLRRAREM